MTHLRGNGTTGYNDDKPQGLKKFLENCINKPSDEEKKLFVQALNAQKKGDNRAAEKKYSELKSIYQNNPVVIHNRSLLK